MSKNRIEISIPKDMLKLLLTGTTVEIDAKEEVWVMRLDPSLTPRDVFHVVMGTGYLDMNQFYDTEKMIRVSELIEEAGRTLESGLRCVKMAHSELTVPNDKESSK